MASDDQQDMDLMSGKSMSDTGMSDMEETISDSDMPMKDPKKSM